MMRHAARGFTLIELMLVVAIIGILAAIALPAYNDYDRWGRMPADNAAAGIAAPEVWRGGTIIGLHLTDGNIEVMVDNKNLPRNSIFLRPATRTSHPTASIVWVCNSNNAPAGFELRGSVDLSKVPNKKYLPAVCR